MESSNLVESQWNFSVPKEWINLSQNSSTIKDQYFMYLEHWFHVSSVWDIIYVKNQNGDHQLLCLSAFLLKLDPTFRNNQFISQFEDISITYWKKLARLLKSGRIKCEFIVDNNKLHVILETNKKNHVNYSFFFDVTNHFVITNNSFKNFCILRGQISSENIGYSDSNNLYIAYIITLLNRF